MVSFSVSGQRGMLGSVVKRRWLELGAEWSSFLQGDYIINCARTGNAQGDLFHALELEDRHPRVIQPSSDAIAEHDTFYAYGKQRLEALSSGVVIRSGIVDLRKSYTHANWRLNPLTPLEWADLAWEVKDQPGLHIDGREPITRYELGLLIAEVFGTEPPEATWAEVPLSRVQMHSLERPPMREALIAYRDWLRS